MINWSTISLLDLAGFVSENLRKKGIETVLVGGALASQFILKIGINLMTSIMSPMRI